jgi:Kdo2-lipid IVA lauroyltransferase/acyltransferase
LQQLTPFQRQHLHPRFWLTWLGFALISIIVRLPHRFRIGTGALLGAVGYRLAKSRRHIVDVNLRLCFPTMSQAERLALAKRVFRSSGISIIETACVWLRDPQDFRPLVKINGLANLQAAIAQGKGVILLGMHLSTLDFCGAVLASYVGFDVMYRRNKNSLLESIMTRGRERNHPHAIDREDVRKVIGNLKKGHAVWYGADQDYGRKHSVFVPFFGQKAATITATSRLAKVNDSPVVLFTHYRSPDDSHYEIFLSEPLAAFPSDQPETDATTINQHVERAILKQPDQYWWLHRRFKTQPEGMKRPY